MQVASEEDLPLLCAFEADLDTRRFIFPTSSEQHAANLSEGLLLYLRIVEDNRTVGFFLLRLDPDGRSVEFCRIVVGEKGRGIGQRAIALLEKWVRATYRRDRIWLDVYDDNTRGRHIYEKLGYQRFGQTEMSGRKMSLYEKML